MAINIYGKYESKSHYSPNERHIKDMADCRLVFRSDGTCDLRVYGNGHFTVDRIVAESILHGNRHPEYGLHRLSESEKLKYVELEKELKDWKYKERLKQFSDLSPHLRQDIIDEAIVYNLSSSLDESLDEKAFPKIKDLEDLGYTANNNKDACHRDVDTSNFKYYYIFKAFKLNDLQNAHFNATLEEELSSKTNDE